MLCPNCQMEPAIMHPQLGPLPCLICKARLDNYPTPKQAVEIIPERIKKEREERGDSIEQPHLKGELNKRYVDLWGAEEAKKRGFTDKEIKNARYVYDGIRTKNTAARYYKDRS